MKTLIALTWTRKTMVDGKEKSTKVTRNVTLETRDFTTVQSITENAGSESAHCLFVTNALHNEVKAKARSKFNAEKEPTQEVAEQIVKDLANTSITVRNVDPELARNAALLLQLKAQVASGNFTTESIREFFANIEAA